MGKGSKGLSEGSRSSASATHIVLARCVSPPSAKRFTWKAGGKAHGIATRTEERERAMLCG